MLLFFSKRILTSKKVVIWILVFVLIRQAISISISPEETKTFIKPVSQNFNRDEVKITNHNLEAKLEDENEIFLRRNVDDLHFQLISTKTKSPKNTSSEGKDDGDHKAGSENDNLSWNNLLSYFNESLQSRDYKKLIPKEYKEIAEWRGTGTLWNHLIGALSLSRVYLPSKSSSPKCQESLKKLLEPDSFGFTLAMIDSWGKFPDGMLTGNFRPLGMYEQCINLHQEMRESYALQGRYCFVQMVKDTSDDDEASRDKAMIPRPKVAPIFIAGSIPQGTFAYGTCFPDDCTQGDFEESLNAILAEDVDNKKAISRLGCKSLRDEKESLNGGDISLIAFMVVVAFLIMCATWLDVYSEKEGKQHLRKGHLRFLLTFSLRVNFARLFHINTNPPKDNINCLHGLRVFSMIWVISGHQYIYPLLVSTSNILDAPRKTDGFLFQIFFNGDYCVDSFFFLSGLLVAYMVLKSMGRNNGKINYPMYYLHRYIRLTPALAMTAWFTATLSRFFVAGPYSVKYDQWVEDCRNNWWKDVLYINDFWQSITEEGNMDCVGQAWYTSTDMQIYIFMPLILVPLFHYRVWGKVLLGVVTLLSCIIPATFILTLGFPPFNAFVKDPDISVKYFYYMYVNPLSRAGPYLVGVWIGYLLYLRRGRPLRLRKWQVVLGWFLSTGLAVAVLFGIYNYNILGPDAKTDWTWAMQFFYGGFSRALWAAPLGWIVVACHFGYGGPVNWFLSHPVFQPASRLTYSMFLMALGIQYMVTLSNKTLFYFSHLNKINEICGALFFAFLPAVLLAVTIELPFMNLEKEILGKPGVNVDKKAKNDDKELERNIQREKTDKEVA